MPARNLSRINEDGVYLHIYNKGIENRAIFNDKQDFHVFVGFLEEYLSTPKDAEATKTVFQVHGKTFKGTPHQPKNYFNQIELIAYSLMPSHFHLILHQLTKGSAEKFLRSLSTRYSIYFNKKYDRSGVLFSGPYKSVKVELKPSLFYLVRFIHQGSLYSSAAEYLDSKSSWVNPEVVLNLLRYKNIGYQNFVEDGKIDSQIDLAKITLEPESNHSGSTTEEVKPLERRILESDAKSYSNRTNLFLISFAIFLMFLTVGIGNLMLSLQPAVLGTTQATTSQPSFLSTAIPFLPLAAATALVPLLVWLAFKRKPLSSKAATPIQPTIQSEEQASRTDRVGISDIDKRVFLKLIGGAGIFLFFFSLFNRKAESLFFKNIPGSVSGKVSLQDKEGNAIDPAQNQPLDGYNISEIDDNIIAYYGFINKDGAWYILRADTAKGSFRYAKDNTNFSANWSNREKLNYDYYNNVF